MSRLKSILNNTYLRLMISLIFLIILFFEASFISLYFFEREQIQGMSWAQVVYYILLSAMGEQPIEARTTGGTVTLILVVVFGVFIVIHVFEQLSGSVIENKLDKLFKRNRYIPKHLKNHVIVCGFNEISREVVKELESMGKRVVVITESLKMGDREDLKARDMGYLITDQLLKSGKDSKESPLSLAGIRDAESVILTLEKEADNAFLCLTAKDLNKNVRVISHTNEYTEKMIRKFRKAGAEHIISHEVVGGHLLAMAGIKPLSTDFIQDVSTSSYGIDVLEVKVSGGSELVGKLVADGYVKSKTNTTVVGIRKGGDLIFNPEYSTILEAGDILIAIGENKDLVKLKEIAGE
jgi:voltage-gated potassium channel